MVLASKIDQVVNLRDTLRSSVEDGAQALLGCNLVKGNMIAQIVETEAYTWDDPGCHAYGKVRMKNMAMYGSAGTAYVYFTYGNHWMLNVVADEDGVAGAVLIRAAKPMAGLDEFRANRPNIVKDRDLMSGPGRLAKAFDIDSRFNFVDLLDPDSELHIVKSRPCETIGISKRIGITVGKGDDLERRFFDVDNQSWVTKHSQNIAFLCDK